MTAEGLQRLGRYVYDLRTSKRLSLEKVREMGGPSVGWVSSLENGTLVDEPKPATLRKLAKALEVPYEELEEVKERRAQSFESALNIPGVSRGMPKPKPIPEADLNRIIRNAPGVTEDELRVYADAVELDTLPFSMQTPDFWALPVEVRRRTIRTLDSLNDEERQNRERFKQKGDAK